MTALWKWWPLEGLGVQVLSNEQQGGRPAGKEGRREGGREQLIVKMENFHMGGDHVHL